MSANTRLRYGYRDASNYKQVGEEVFPGTVTDEDLARLVEHLDDGCWFIAEQVGLPDLRELWPSEVDDDHIWHELDPTEDIEPTDDAPTRSETVGEFVDRFVATVWDVDAAVERLEQRRGEGR